MTNKQAYAETMGRVNEALHDAERFESLSATVRCVDLRALLKRVGEIEGLLAELRNNIGAASLVRNPIGIEIRAKVDAALNSDAPLSIGEEQ